MGTETNQTQHPPDGHDPGRESVDMPAPTAAPLVLSLGLVLLAAGTITSVALVIIGAGLSLIGLCQWMAHLLPGQGHIHEPFVAPALRPQPIVGVTGTVEQLRLGVPGYRIRMPEDVHPISAGIKGGILGGVVMPLPALTYGMLSGHGIWYPINLLAGMVVPGVEHLTTAEFEQFHLSYVVLALAIHAVMSVSLGSIYGVLMPTLPDIPKPMAWGALLAPMLWTGVSYALMSLINPTLAHRVDWFWFITSQFLFGVMLASVVLLADEKRPFRAGLLGSLVGAMFMPLPAIAWGYFTDKGIWYPMNLLAGMVIRGMDQMPIEELEEFHPEWLFPAIALHFAIALGFGGMLGLLLPRLPSIPGPLAWGGMLLPLVWTATSYAMMGVVNPSLAERVDWPWFIFSQIIFGLTAAVVVVRSEMVHIPPAGTGPDEVPVTEGP
jgi:hypothetical protein